MRKLIVALLLICTGFICNIAIGQNNNSNDLQGEMELTVDISKMRDTAGRFMIMIGGEIFYPQIKDNKFFIKKMMEEPRRSHFNFYTNQDLKNNPGKELNYIAAKLANYFEFMAVPGKYTIIVKDSVANSEIINASPYQKQYSELVKLKKNYDDTLIKKHSALITKITNETNKQTKDSLISTFYSYYREGYRKYYNDRILGFIKNNPDSPASLFELSEYSNDSDKSLKTLTILYNNLTERLKALRHGKIVYGTIDAESFAADTLIGQLAPDFTINDASGKAVSLKDYRGNVILLEFWASWCGACRASNPGLVKAYKKYHNKGFEILGVSLDGDKKNWLKAVKEDGLIWKQVSDLKEFESDVATLYHIHYLPSNFLIDKTGKVIAANLDEQQLNKYLEKIFK